MNNNGKAIPLKQNWLTRCIQIQQFHASQMKEEPEWNLAKTAKALDRSIGSVSEDITIALWLRSHDKAIRRCKYRQDALELIREKKFDSITS